MKKSKNAFTMIELVFVIVILGILSAVAIPKLAATRSDAEAAKIRSDVAAIRSSIITERQTRLIRGESSFISSLDRGVASNTDGVAIFDGNDTTHILLTYPIYTAKKASNEPISGKWLKTGNNQYSASVGGTVVVFTYTPSPNGLFDCNHTDSKCRLLLR